MSDSHLDETAWRPWIADVCATVDIDPESVSVEDIHDLTRVIAHRFTRPMAPVAAYIWALARATHPDADPAALGDAIASCMPERA